ncbi:hypothetical protein O0L34_g13970 [Tuta absoluta]|nr:hypothetical protein O0L34_g13970 [Tuta absoluta]
MIVTLCLLTLKCVEGMTRQQLKNSGKMMKKSCMPKNDVTEDQVGNIEQGKFLEERNVMCYMACIYGMMQVVKNGKVSPEAVMKTVDLMFPAEMKEPVKAAAEKCKEHAKRKDLCEAAFYSSKCMYEADPKNFFFP